MVREMANFAARYLEWTLELKTNEGLVRVTWKTKASLSAQAVPEKRAKAV